MARTSGTHAILDGGLVAACERLVGRSLAVVRGERVVLVHDRLHDAVASALAAAVTALSAEAVVFALEDLGPRPHAHLPRAIADALDDAQASVMLVSFHAGELAMRAEAVDIAKRRGLRHAHMVGVSRASLVAGFSVDPSRVAAQAASLSHRLRPDSRITVKNAAGTDLVVTLSPRCRWLEFGVVVPPGKAANLPGGELVTSPASVDGVCVADATIGDAEGRFTRRLAATPLTLKIAASRVTSLACPNDPMLVRDLEIALSRTTNLDRVGLVGFGVNVGLTEPVGDVASDQKMPGLHPSLGETFADRTGATWTASTWIGLALSACDVDIDGAAVLRRGRYLV